MTLILPVVCHQVADPRLPLTLRALARLVTSIAAECRQVGATGID